MDIQTNIWTKLHRIIQIDAIKTILEQAPDILPIACGGGGIPVSRIPSNPQTLTGVEAVIDKDACGAKLAVELDADGFIILTDGGGIWQNFGKPNAREMKKASPGEWTQINVVVMVGSVLSSDLIHQQTINIYTHTSNTTWL